MDRSGEMTAFVRSVDGGGFSAAARELGLTPSALSKLVTRLKIEGNRAELDGSMMVGKGPLVLGGWLSQRTAAQRQRLEAWLAQLRQAPLVALDTETDSLDAMRAHIVGISLATEPGVAAYVPLAHSYPGVPEQLPLDQVLQRLRPWLEDAARAKLGQNLKYDWHVLANHGITLRGVHHDTLLQSYVLEAHRPHGLESLAERHLGRRGLSYEELCGKGVHQIPFAQVDLERATRYSGEDSEMALQLHRTLWPQLEAEPGLRYVYEQLEMPTLELLQRIERHGVLIDVAQLALQSRELGERLLALEQQRAGSYVLQVSDRRGAARFAFPYLLEGQRECQVRLLPQPAQIAFFLRWDC